jgi:hypothetical protein
MVALVLHLTDEAFKGWWCASSMRVQEEEHRRGFNSPMVLGVWVIWKHKNFCVFNGVEPSVSLFSLACLRKYINTSSISFFL